MNPLNIFRSIWPDNILAPNLRPNDIFLAIYDINSINTNTGTNNNGQPEGINRLKNLILCLFNPNNVVPNTIVKLIYKVNIKCYIKLIHII